MLQFFRALRAGAVVSDPKNLKQRQQMLDALMVLLGIGISLAAKAGYVLEMSIEDQTAVAGGILAVYSAVSGMLSSASTDKIGILPAKPDDRRVDEQSGGSGPAF